MEIRKKIKKKISFEKKISKTEDCFSFCQNDIFKKIIEIFQCIRGMYGKRKNLKIQKNYTPHKKKLFFKFSNSMKKNFFQAEVGWAPPPNKKRQI